jgi:hypothetical protein
MYRLKAPKGNKIKTKIIDPESILEPIKSKSHGNFLKVFQTFTKLIQIRIVAIFIKKRTNFLLVLQIILRNDFFEWNSK